MRRLALTFVILLSMAIVQSCVQQGDVFDSVGDEIASPSSMAIDVASGRLYLVNSNSRVLYDWNQGNFQVYDITDPLAPVLIKSVLTDSFSGEIYLDTVGSTAYVPNRYTSNSSDMEDRMYAFSTSEATSEGLLGFTTSALGRDSFAIACCYPDGRAWITTSLGEVQYVDLAGDLVPGSISLLTTLDDGGTFVNSEVYHVVLKDNQSYLSRMLGGIFILNLDEAGVDGAEPVDYFIADVPTPRGIAIDGDTLYVVGEGNDGGSYKKFVLILDVSTLTPLVDNTTTLRLDKEDDGLLVALVEIGRNPQELLLTDDYVFVTVMDDDVVSVIDRTSMTVVADVEVGDQPFSLALYRTDAGVDQYVYVGNLASNTISIIDIPTLSVVATYP